MAGALEIIQVVAEMAMLGQRLLNVYHFISNSAVPDGQILDDMATKMDTAYGYVDNAMSPELSFVTINIKNLTDNSDIGVSDWSLTTGLSASDPLPTGVAALITFPTGILGCRGRKFLPGFSEVTTEDGLFTTTVMGNLASFGAEFILPFSGAISGDLWVPGVVRTSGAFQPTTGATASNIPAYQRRRKIGVGA